MAELNINIVNETVDLIKNLQETSNSCTSQFTFDIETTSGADVTITLDDSGNTLAYDTAKIKIGDMGIYENIVSSQIYTLPGGKATVVITIGNNDNSDIYLSDELQYACNTVKVTVTDINKNVSEADDLYRCVEAARC